MNRSTTLLLIAVALAAYGVYAAGHALAMLVGASEPVLLLCFILQAVCAFAAALGVWRRLRWAAAVVVLLGVSVAGTCLIAAFVIGIVAYLYALVIAVLALLITLILAAYLGRPGSIAKE
jgi:hypothetical protein